MEKNNEWQKALNHMAYMAQRWYPRENRKLSLRQCAMADAFAWGQPAVDELKKKWRSRKLNYRRGKKTNVGDPMAGQSFKKAKR